jgi:DNA-binding response OmpR family regulator
MAGQRVLIVEDDSRLGEILSRALTRRGHAVRLVGLVAEGREAMGQWPPDVLLLDIDLPDGAGWELLRDSETATERAVVVVMSAGQPARRRIEQFRPFCVLTKPFAIDTLLGVIERAGEAETIAADEFGVR